MHDCEESQHADRNVDKEYPRPAVIVGDPTTESGSDRRRDDSGDCRQTKGARALSRTKGVEQDRLLGRLQSAAKKPLHRPGNNQFEQIPRQAAAALATANIATQI